jgi:type II secretory pathway pseudopilin PulG
MKNIAIKYGKLSGFSLIEMTVFIIVLALLTVGVMQLFLFSTRYIATSEQKIIALNLAQARMEIIIGQRQRVGFDQFYDICANSRLPLCFKNEDYETVSSISKKWKGLNHFKVVNVSVNRKDRIGTRVTLTRIVADD